MCNKVRSNVEDITCQIVRYGNMLIIYTDVNLFLVRLMVDSDLLGIFFFNYLMKCIYKLVMCPPFTKPL